MKLSFVLLAVLLGIVSCNFTATDGVFKRSEGTMNIATNLMLKWTVMENDEVTFEFSAPTTGWLGFGLRTSAGMAGADFFYSNGQTVVDSTGNESGNPTVDTTNNVSDATVTTSGEVKTIKFTRMLNTGDSNDVTIGIGSAINAIYAYGTDASIDMTANNVMSGNFTFTPEEASWSNQTKTLQTGRIVTHRAYTMNDTKYFVMEFTAPAPGWLGIGFGVSNTMAGSDVVYYSAPTSDGDLTLTDAHNDSNGPPTTDATQNVNLLYYTTDGSSTSTIRFYRKFDTGDADDDFVIPDSGSMNMIWACSGSKVLAKHADPNRGSFTFDIQDESGDHASIGMVVSYMAAFFFSALFFFH